MDLYLHCKNIIAIEKNRANKTQKTLVGFFSVEAENCQDIFKRRCTTSGIYTIYPWDKSDRDLRALDVFCDMETLGGGWTVSINY